MLKLEIKEHAIMYKRGLRLKLITEWDDGQNAREARAMVARAGWQDLVANDAPAASYLAEWASRVMPKPLLKLKVNGQWVDDPDVLISEVKTELEKTFSSSFITSPSLNASIYSTLDKLPKDLALTLDASVTESEVLAALKSLNKNKSPGVDGLTPEFYLKFWDALRTPFMGMVRDSFSKCRLPRSTCTAIISMIPKSSTAEAVGDLRPLSLTNTDYKIIAKTLANRLSGVIDTVVSDEQSYCVPGRTIYDAISVVRDLIRRYSETDEELAVLSLDQKKAFDYVSHDHLFSVLQHMGFGPVFINMLKTLYFNSKCMARIGPCLSAPFYFSQGIRQGCPLSGQLYSLAFEPFVRLLKAKLSAINIPGTINTGTVVSVYADDISIFISDETDLHSVMQIFDIYSQHSGARLNLGKCHGLWVGRWRGRTDKPLGIRWSADGFRCLGIWLDVDRRSEDAIIEREMFSRISQAISRWKLRVGPMSLRGRVLACNQFIAPKIWHLLQSYTPEDATVRKLQAMLVDFIWHQRKHWISASTLMAPVKEGGLGLVDLSAKILGFRFQLAQRILFSKRAAPWRMLSLDRIAAEWILDDTYHMFVNPETITTGYVRDRFHRSIMEAWKAFAIIPMMPPNARRAERPFPTGWPPPNVLPTFNFCSRRTESIVPLPLTN
jgi:hypothetical protein